jgi:hypothetical protein
MPVALVCWCEVMVAGGWMCFEMDVMKEEQ